MTRLVMNRSSQLVLLATALLGVNSFCVPLWAQSDSRSDSANQAGLTVAQAVKQAKKTGQPIFAIAYSESCPACRALRNTVATETSLHPVLAQYVPLAINVESKEFRSWERSFPRKSASIPGVYVVASNGKQVFGTEGSMPAKELKKTLLDALEKLGRFPTEEQWQQIAQIVEPVEKALQEDQIEQAIGLMEPMLTSLSHLGALAEISETAKQASQLFEQLVKKQQSSLDEALQAYAKDANFEAALQVASAERLGKMFPQLRLQVAADVKKSASSAAQRKQLRQARALHLAEKLAEQEGSQKKAESALKRVVKRYPNSEAAVLALRKLNSLNGAESIEAAAADEGSPFRLWSDSTGKFSIQARLLNIKGSKVRLERADGKVLSIPISKLNEQGQRYVAQSQL